MICCLALRKPPPASLSPVSSRALSLRSAIPARTHTFFHACHNAEGPPALAGMTRNNPACERNAGQLINFMQLLRVLSRTLHLPILV